MLKKSKPINIFLIILIFLTAVAQVVILNRDSTSGENLSKINLGIERIEKENDKLNQQIASSSALTTISERAKNLGLVSTRYVVSLSIPPKLALGTAR